MPAGAVVEGNNTIGGAIGPYRNAGAPVAAVNEVDTLTFGGTITGGTFTATVAGFKTAPIAWSATNATLVANIDAALEALPSVGTGGVTTAVGTMTAGIGTITVTFNGADTAGRVIGVSAVDGSQLTGTAPTVAVAQTTAGVSPTHRNAAIGALLVDTTNAQLYQNTGTVLGAPAWTKVGAQS